MSVPNPSVMKPLLSVSILAPPKKKSCKHERNRGQICGTAIFYSDERNPSLALDWSCCCLLSGLLQPP